MQKKIVFIIKKSGEEGFTARALGESIFTEGDNFTELKANIKDAVLCHYDEGAAPKIILKSDNL